jgi:hypothetical protein
MQENNQQPELINTETGEAFEIPEEGSLGLLALGYQGFMLWRAKKNEIREQKNNDEL